MREPLLDSLVEQFFALGATHIEFTKSDPWYFTEDQRWIMHYQYNGWTRLAACGKTKREAICRALRACTEGDYRLSPKELVEAGGLPF